MHPGQLEPNALEAAILDRIATVEPSIKAALKELHVLSREYTGVGSFTTFQCDESDSDSDKRQLGLDALIRVSSVPNGLGAILFCSGDNPECLEVYTYGDEPWDGTYDGFSIDESP